MLTAAGERLSVFERMRVPRIPDGFLLTTIDYDTAEPVEWYEHAHVEYELLWSNRGMVTLEVDGRVWAIPPELGVWIPASVPHRASAAGNSAVRATYFVEVASHMSAMPNVVTAVTMSEPLRVLLHHNLQADLDSEARLRLQRVILDLLRPASQASFDLNMPTSQHLRRIAQAVIADPADKRTTADWALFAGMHSRTLARQFEAETGATFTQWRILARLQVAIRELSNGHTVSRVSRSLGYRNVSTFIDHFRELTGQTPAEFARNDAAARR